MKKEHIVVNGLDVAYAEQGHGPVVLLLHGWGTNLHTFDQLVAHWGAEEKRFVALDLPGFGDSEHPPTAWDVSAYVSFIRSFLTKLKIDQTEIVIGHSLGGRLAIKGVADDVLRPKQLVLVAAAGTAVRRTVRNTLFMVAAKVGKFFLSIPPLSLFKTTVRKKLYAAAGSTDYLYAGNMKDTFLNVVRENLTHAAEQIHTPTLIVWGEQDAVTPLAEARTLHAAISNSKLTTISHAGHFVHEEKPQETAQALMTFIAV